MNPKSLFGTVKNILNQRVIVTNYRIAGGAGSTHEKNELRVCAGFSTTDSKSIITKNRYNRHISSSRKFFVRRPWLEVLEKLPNHYQSSIVEQKLRRL